MLCGERPGRNGGRCFGLVGAHGRESGLSHCKRDEVPRGGGVPGVGGRALGGWGLGEVRNLPGGEVDRKSPAAAGPLF